MLARLQKVEGVAHAGVDYGGNFLHLTIESPTGLIASTIVLRELGYEPEVAEPGAAIPTRWYDTSSVDELSAVEASVIARRVVSRFLRSNALAEETATRLQAAVAAALQRCFTGRELAGRAITAQFRRDCLRAAGEAAAEIVGSAATAFVAALDADLNEDHTHDAGL